MRAKPTQPTDVEAQHALCNDCSWLLVQLQDRKGSETVVCRLTVISLHSSTVLQRTHLDSEARSTRETDVSSSGIRKERYIDFADLWQDMNRKYFSGWRFTVFSGAVLSSLVLLVNLIPTLFAMFKNSNDERDRKDGAYTLYKGRCDLAAKFNLGSHILINDLGSMLLAASNFSMQCLSAPTRAEIDKAHAQKTWLDVGILSLRNLRWTKPSRMACVILLVLSSLPLHLM